MLEYFAHSENNKQEKHQLSKHLLETGTLAEKYACKKEYKTLFKIAGLLHDLGKYQPEFQRYLENGGRRGSVPHAAWGAGYARKMKQDALSFAIDGHHKGLPNSFYPETPDRHECSFQIGKRGFFVLARKSRDCAEAYSPMSHKQARRLTPPGRKSTLSGWKPNRDICKNDTNAFIHDDVAGFDDVIKKSL